MSSAHNHEAHDYAERIRERLPRRLQELREAERLSMYALWQKCGVSRDTISRVEAGETIPGVHVLARLAWGVEKTITDFFSGIEDEPGPS
jgi:transcriptional regulator with XRE-family HTH domain